MPRLYYTLSLKQKTSSHVEIVIEGKVLGGAEHVGECKSYGRRARREEVAAAGIRTLLEQFPLPSLASLARCCSLLLLLCSVQSSRPSLLVSQ